MDIKRKDAAFLLEAILLFLSKENAAGRATRQTKELEDLITSEGLTLPIPCDGEAHLNAHIDNCGKCLHGLDWGWVGERVKVK